MSPVAMVAIASALGAVLFFLAGFFASRAKTTDASAQPPIAPPVPVDDARVRALEAHNHDLAQRTVALEAEAQRARTQAAAAEAERNAARERAALADSDAAALRTRAVELESSLRAANAATAASATSASAVRAPSIAPVEGGDPALAQKTQELTQRNQELTRRMAELRAVEQQRDGLQRDLDGLQVELDTARIELKQMSTAQAVHARQIATLHTQLAMLRTQLNTAQTRVEKTEEFEVGERTEVLPSIPPTPAPSAGLSALDVAELARLRADRDRALAERTRSMTALESAQQSLDQQRALNEQLHVEIARLRGSELAMVPVHAVQGAPREAIEPAAVVLQELVDRVCESRHVRSAAIADEMGFVVVSRGEHGDALAAFGAHVMATGVRVNDLVPLSNNVDFMMRDEHRNIVMVRPLKTQFGQFVVVTLGADSEDDRAPSIAPPLLKQAI